MKNPLIPVILSGGAGTRLWPVSREANPKPFIQLADGQSLLQKTFLRALAIPSLTEVVTVTNQTYYFRTKDEYMDVLNSKDIQQSYILEPEAKNTAPAIGIAALLLQKRYGEHAVMMVMPADHVIMKQDAFIDAANTAYKEASSGKIITFGIKPTKPDTGYGYIETESISLNSAARVRRFVEKPDIATAERYLSDGNHLWNSGMFCFQVGAFLKNMVEYAPELFDRLSLCFEVSEANQQNTRVLFEMDKKTFADVPSISVDYAVMEKASDVEVIPCDIGWSDVGSWDSLSALEPVDNLGNCVEGEAILDNVSNTYIRAEQHLVAALGVKDLIIIDTPDALLVSHRDCVQDVRRIVQRLKSEGHESHVHHLTVHRPWGTYTVLEEGVGFKIKRIVVKPTQQLSLQMHHHRSEHWIVVSGIAKVVNGDETLIINRNESTYIPAGHKHRLENTGTEDLILIEVQSGDYLGEDDIVRFQDQYGRV